MAQFGWPPKSLPNFNAAVRDTRSKQVKFRRNAAIALGLAGEENRKTAIENLKILLSDEDAGVRIEAILSAAGLEAKELTPLVLEKLTSNNESEKMAALDFFSKCAEKNDFEKLVEFFEKEKNPWIKSLTLETLSDLDPESTRLIVLEELKKGENLEPDYTRNLIALICEIGEPQDTERLLPLLDHHSISVRIQTASSLAIMERFEPLAKIRNILENSANLIKIRELREIAIEGLCKLYAYFREIKNTEENKNIIKIADKNFRSFFTPKREKIYWCAILSGEGLQKATDFLNRIQKSKNRPLAIVVFRAVCLCRLKEWIEPIKNYIKSLDYKEDIFLLEEAIHSLSIMNCKESIQALTEIEIEFSKIDSKMRDLIRVEKEISEKIISERDKYE